jgi:26S proteasome regulatory subunit N5
MIISTHPNLNKMEEDYLKDLLIREKELRQAEEVSAADCEKVLIDIIERVKAKGNWDTVGEWVQILAKRRRQPKQSIVGMVKHVMAFLEELERDHPLLGTLRTVCEGKIYLEIEFARLTKRMAENFENQKNLEKASSLLQEVQVETYGSMDKAEKLEFLMEQLRLLLALKDFIRFHIISKKVNKKILDEAGMEDSKVRFLRYIIQYYDHQKDYMNVALSYKNIFDMFGNSYDGNEALQEMVIHLMLVPFSAEQADLLRRIPEGIDKDLAVVVSILTGKELGRSPASLERLMTEEKWKILQRRINQHNIRTIQVYYKRITLRRISELLDMPEADAETEIRDMVSYMGFSAKINRLEGFVYFSKKADAHEKLNEWGTDIYSLLNKLEEVTHLIHREKVIGNA